MTRRFLAIGECMVELAPQADGRYAMGFAGDTFNTAWYARQVTGPWLDVAYLTAFGDDAISARMRRFMAAAGVRPEGAVRTGRGPGLYLITLDAGERSFAYWRDTSAARSLADDLAALPDLRPGDLAYFSGITLGILPEAGRARLLAAVHAARQAGVTIAFDPNLRPRLWARPAEMRDWVMRGAAVADLALPSFADDAQHFGDADPAATARRYLGAGARLAVVKDAANPVQLVSAAATSVVPTTPVRDPVDTTAAGDSFNARFCAGLLRGEGAEAAARAACALSAAVIAARGALVARAWSAPIALRA